MSNGKPAIIVISSHVVRGTVGNRAAGFALEVMGYPVWLVPTITLPWHPGHGAADRITPSSQEFSKLLDDLGTSPFINEVGAVLTGYLGSVDQVEPISRLIDRVKANNPAALYALDPVVGDGQLGEEGRLYVPEEQADAIRSTLLPRADIVTPNPFEMGWLAGTDTPKSNEDLIKAAQGLGTKTVLATSAEAMMRGSIANLLIQKDVVQMAEHRLLQGPPNGLGDLAAALMLGNYLSGQDAVLALKKTTQSLNEVMIVAARSGSDELPLEASIGSIIQPRTDITMRIVRSKN